MSGEYKRFVQVLPNDFLAKEIVVGFGRRECSIEVGFWDSRTATGVTRRTHTFASEAEAMGWFAYLEGVLNS